MDIEAIRSQKKDLRGRIHKIIDGLTEVEIKNQSSIITLRAVALPEYQNAKSLSIFLSMPGKEVSTLEIVHQAFRDGKKVYVPYIHKSKRDPKMKIMDMLRLMDEQDLASLGSDSWGIPSLSNESIEQRENALGGKGCFEASDTASSKDPHLDLIFMPAMAFDTSLNRLGHGKGFYDRYLSLYQSLCSPMSSGGPKFPHLVGLALREQMLSSPKTLPTSELDWKVDRVLTSGA